PSRARANYEIGPLIARVRDHVGFYLTEKKLASETLSVMPRPERLRGVQLRPRHVGPWPGVIPSKALGLGTEFYSMRKYIPGDDPKRINWKASARYNELIVNEPEAERVTDVMNLLARRMLPSRSQIVIITPLLDPELREGVKQLTIAGYSMLILSPSPTPPTSVRDQTEEIAFKFIMLERSISLLALERSSTVV